MILDLTRTIEARMQPNLHLLALGQMTLGRFRSQLVAILLRAHQLDDSLAGNPL